MADPAPVSASSGQGSADHSSAGHSSAGSGGGAGDDSLQPELADVFRLGRRLMRRAVGVARGEDHPLRRVLHQHLGPGASSGPGRPAPGGGSGPAWTASQSLLHY